MKKGWTIVGIILLLIIVIAIIYYFTTKSSENKRITKGLSADGKEKILTYRLPTSKDSDVFGPPFWESFHNLASEIPCSICREDGESLMIFAHDLVNVKLDKKIYNQENFDKWLEFISTIKK